jgi:hypothetical protein
VGVAAGLVVAVCGMCYLPPPAAIPAAHQERRRAMRKHRDFDDLPCFRDHA